MAEAADAFVYKEILIVLVTAGFVIPLFTRLKINPIIGFLIVGAFIGPNVLGELVGDFPWLSVLIIGERQEIARLAELGVVFLLFIVGIELSFERVLPLRRLVLGFGSVQVIVSAAVIAIILAVAGLTPTEALVVGLALSLSSTAIVIQLLSDQRRLGTQTGRTSFAILLFQDLAVVPILLLVPALGTSGGDHVALGVIVALLQAGVTILLIVVIGRLALRPLLRLVASTRSPDLFMAATLLIVVGAALISDIGGLSMALGAFIAGLLLAETEYRREIEAIVEPFKGILLGTYFLLVGMGMNLKLLLAFPVWIVAMALGLIAIKAAIIVTAGGYFRLPRPALIRTALLLGPGGEFAFVIMAAGITAGVVAVSTSQIVTLVVSIAMLLIPVMAFAGNRLTAKLAVQAAMLPSEARIEPVPDQEVQAIVVGFGRVGTLVGSMLEEQSIPYLGIEADPEVVAKARRAGRPLYYGDATRAELLRKCGIEKALAIVVTMDSPSKVDQVVRVARAERADIKIIARARDENHAIELYQAGVTEAVPETSEASLQLGEAVLVEVGVPMGLAIAAIHERRDALRRLLGRPDRRREVGLARARFKRLKQKEKS